MMWHWSDLKSLLSLRKAQEFSDTAVVVWNVAYPEDRLPPEEPHCTILYFGDITQVNYTKEDVIDAIKETDYNVYMWSDTQGIEMFGPEKDVPVATLNHPYLHRYHDALESSLARRGIIIDHTFPEYRPHVSISTEPNAMELVPDKFFLGPVELWWGGEHIRINER